MAIPDNMIGDFQMESSVGFNDFMWELGVNFVTRNIANNLYPLQKIRQQDQDGQISINTETSFRCTETKFILGVAWQETTADGRETTTTAKLEENKLIKHQIPEASTGYHTTFEIREFLDDGETMKLHLEIPAKPAIICQRIYKRVKQEEATQETTEEAKEETGGFCM